MDEVDLRDSLASAQKGDDAGFETLWRALQPAVLRYVRVVAGDGAEDVASETWLQVARDIRDFQGDLTSFRVWLFRIARNRGIDHQRRAARRREDSYDRLLDDAVAEDSSAVAIEAIDTQWAVRLIASLPQDQAEAIMLRVVAGLDVAQTAKVLGKRPGAVRIAAMRGLRRLAARVEVRQRRAEWRGGTDTTAADYWHRAVGVEQM